MGHIRPIAFSSNFQKNLSVKGLIAPPPTDPFQLLFCTLYAWNDDELIAPPAISKDPVQLLFCTLYAWNDVE